jgi:hypothetical protein
MSHRTYAWVHGPWYTLRFYVPHTCQGLYSLLLRPTTSYSITVCTHVRAIVAFMSHNTYVRAIVCFYVPPHVRMHASTGHGLLCAFTSHSHPTPTLISCIMSGHCIYVPHRRRNACMSGPQFATTHVVRMSGPACVVCFTSQGKSLLLRPTTRRMHICNVRASMCCLLLRPKVRFRSVPCGFARFIRPRTKRPLWALKNGEIPKALKSIL